METNDRRYGHFFKGLLIGGFLGGVAGLLFAPKPGMELRSGIKATGDEAFKGAREILGQASHQFSEMRERAKQILSRIKGGGRTTPEYGVESAQESVGEA